MADTADWVTVSNGDRDANRNRNKRQRVATPPPTQVSNSFAPLAALLTENPLASTASFEQALLSDNTPAPMEQSSTTSERVPPIFVTGITDHRPLIAYIKQYTTAKDFFLVAKGDTFKVQLKNRLDYVNFVGILKTNNITFHTFSTPEERMSKFVIRGLPLSCDLETIKSDLIAQGLQPDKVSQLHSPTVEKTPLPLFAFTVKRNTVQATPPTALRFVYHHKVNIEIFRGTKGPIQCFRCQRFGHSDAHCQNVTRCFKCAGFHPSKECTKSRDVPCVCVNCDGAHPASYRQCDAYKRALDSMTQQRTDAGRQRRDAPPRQQQSAGRQQGETRQYNNSRPGVSYSQATNGADFPPLFSPPPPPPRSHVPPPSRGSNDIWSTIRIISDTIAQTEGVPPTIKILLQLLTELVNAQHPNGGQP